MRLPYWVQINARALNFWFFLLQEFDHELEAGARIADHADFNGEIVADVCLGDVEVEEHCGTGFTVEFPVIGGSAVGVGADKENHVGVVHVIV